LEGLKACLTRTINSAAKRAGKIKEGANLPVHSRGSHCHCFRIGVRTRVRRTDQGRLGNPSSTGRRFSVGFELTKLFDFRPELLDAIYSRRGSANRSCGSQQLATWCAERPCSRLLSYPASWRTVRLGIRRNGNFGIVEGDSAAGSANKVEIDAHKLSFLSRKDPNIERAPAERIIRTMSYTG
jgi:DNA gyrase/topoisomerase IV subunit B